MSLRRLRKLAGIKLNESFTDDPKLNAEIEAAVDRQAPKSHNAWMDILEFIHNAGAPVSGDQVIDHLSQIGYNPEMIRDMMKTFSVKFDNFVDTDDRGGIVWYNWQPMSERDDDEIPAEVQAAVGSQVDATYTAIEFMRHMTQEKGGFTRADLENALRTKLGIPQEVVGHLAQHILDQFQSMLVKTKRPNTLAMKPEVRNTRDSNMEFFRDLERRAREGDFGKEV